jgi:hypothetical protein
MTRETREWKLLLTVETEVNGTQRVQIKEVFPWLVRWACRAGTRDFCSALATSAVPVQNIFVPIHIKLAKQASRAGLPSLFMCLWPRHTPCSSLTLLNISALLALYFASLKYTEKG